MFRIVYCHIITLVDQFKKIFNILKKFGNLNSLEETSGLETSKSDLDSKEALGVSVFLITVVLQDLTLYCPPAID